MVNYQDPVTILREYSAYTFLLGFSGLQFGLPSPSNSGDGETLARHGWYIYVSPLSCRALAFKFYSTTHPRPYASSWEFFTTLNYEWDVIGGRRPY